MIRTEKLCCGYGSRMVLQNVSLSMEAGELWCVLGANGVGKSTLFKTLLEWWILCIKYFSMRGSL